MQPKCSLVLCSIGAALLPLVGSCRSRDRASDEGTASAPQRSSTRPTPAPPDTESAAIATLGDLLQGRMQVLEAEQRRERMLTFRMPMPAWVRERNGGF